MKRHDYECEYGTPRTDEERRFILWSIARANPKRLPGPYLDGSLRELLTQDQSTLRAAPQKRLTRLRKGPRYYRTLILSRAAAIGGTCGALIGLNVSIVVFLGSALESHNLLLAALPTVLCALLGIVYAWEHVVIKRSDLFGSRYPLRFLRSRLRVSGDTAKSLACSAGRRALTKQF